MSPAWGVGETSNVPTKKHPAPLCAHVFTHVYTYTLFLEEGAENDLSTVLSAMLKPAWLKELWKYSAPLPSHIFSRMK